MSNCECARNQSDCPICEIYNLVYTRFVKTGPLELHDDLEKIVHRAEQEYHHEIINRYDGGIGET